MAEGSGANTPIWVAVITVVGGLLTAVVVNADKWIARSAEPAVAAPAPSPTPTLSPAATPAPAPTPAVATPSPAATPAAAAPETGAGDIAGTWRSDEGGRYDFELKGLLFEATQTSLNGNFQMMIKGHVAAVISKARSRRRPARPAIAACGSTPRAPGSTAIASRTTAAGLSSSIGDGPPSPLVMLDFACLAHPAGSHPAAL